MYPLKAFVLIALLLAGSFANAQEAAQEKIQQVFLDNFPTAKAINVTFLDGSTRPGFQLAIADFPKRKIIKSKVAEVRVNATELVDLGNALILLDKKDRTTTSGDATLLSLSRVIKTAQEGQLYEFSLLCDVTLSSGGKKARPKAKRGTFLVRIGEPPVREKIAAELAGVLHAGPNGKDPIRNKEVLLKSGNMTLNRSTTDNNGAFHMDYTFFKGPRYYLELSGEDLQVSGKVIMSTVNGEVVGAFKRNKFGFTYELLPTIVEKLQPMEEAEPDIAMPAAKPAVSDRQAKLEQFAASEAQSLELVENINYTTGAWEVPADARATLGQIAATMQQYSELSLKISSHTDARGPERENLALSKKRAEAALQFLQQQGIAPGRLSSEGLGESQLINRCKDGVECSDEEHAKNRRTEFRFSR